MSDHEVDATHAAIKISHTIQELWRFPYFHIVFASVLHSINVKWQLVIPLAKACQYYYVYIFFI